MSKELYKRIEIMKDTPNCINLTYYLLEGVVCEEYCDLKIYGVLVEKEFVSKSGRIMRERKSIPDLFFTKQETRQFLEYICNERVMPIDLKCSVKPYIENHMGVKTVKSV